jgi:cytochrome c2
MLPATVGIFGLTALFALAFSLFPAKAASPPEKRTVDVRQMCVKERADLGEKLIFGKLGVSRQPGNIGKAQCTLCHGFNKGSPSERAPNLFGITTRAWERLRDPRYHQGKPGERDTIQKEAFPGSGTGTTAIEYIAESVVCPSCYVVAGYGVKGTNDSESPGVQVYKPPINLSIDELIAIDTWLYVHDGKDPPSPEEIESAYRKFIPESEWPSASRDPESYPSKNTAAIREDATFNLTGKEPITEIFTKPLCFACHYIPGIQGAVGIVGPKLNMKTTALERIRGGDYKGKATNLREYIIESVVAPSIYVLPGYPDIMPKYYGERLNKAVIDRIADYLSQLEEGKEPPKVQ